MVRRLGQWSLNIHPYPMTIPASLPYTYYLANSASMRALKEA